MKSLTMLSLALVVFAAAPVFACGGGDGDKEKDTQAFTTNVQTLCGGDKGDKPKDETACMCTKPKPEPKPEPQCGPDKGDKPDSEPQTLCGGSDSGSDKEESKA